MVSMSELERLLLSMVGRLPLGCFSNVRALGRTGDAALDALGVVNGLIGFM